MYLGTFKIESKLAAGGMGEVWSGVHDGTGTPIVVKVLTGEIAREPRYQQLFHQEVQATARLQHPNIISVYDFGLLPSQAEQLGLSAGSPYYVIEYIEGGSLENISWRFSLVQKTLLAILNGLAHSHARGILHRDIKPGNVLWGTYAGGERRVVLTDFGLAKAHVRDDAGLFELTDQATGDAAGTPAYMAPEQFRGMFRDFGPWTDLYALGIMAFQFVHGRLPFSAPKARDLGMLHIREPLPSFRPQFKLPPGWDDWIARMTAKDFRGRFQSAADAARALAFLEVEDSQEASLQEVPLRTLLTGLGFAETLGTLSGERTETFAVADDELRVTSTFQKPQQRVVPPSDWREVSDQWIQSAWVPPGLELVKWRTPPFIGRAAERDLIWKAFVETVKSGKVSAVIIQGATGTGKSRLARWVQELAAMGGFATTVTALHEEQGSTSQGMPGLMAEYHGCLGLKRGDMLARMTQRMGGGPDVDPLEVRALVEVMGGLREDVSTEVAEVVLNEATRLAVMQSAFARIAADRPVVAFLDDLQWGQATLEFAHALIESEIEVPVLLIATVQDSAANAETTRALQLLRAHDACHSIQLTNFDAGESQMFAREGLALRGDVATLVAEKTQGNPLFATQMVQHWVQTGELVSRGMEFVLTTVTPTIPAQLADLWEQSLEALIAKLSQPRMIGPSQIAVGAPELSIRQQLELAAALGVRVNASEWEMVSVELGLKPVFGLIEDLVAAGLANVTDEGFSFAHGLLRDALRERSLAEGRWKNFNKAIGAMLERRYEVDSSHVNARIAYYQLEAGRLDEAKRCLQRELVRMTEYGESDRHFFRDFEASLKRLGLPVNDPQWVELWMLNGEGLVLRSDPESNRRGHEMLQRAMVVAYSQKDPVLLGRALRANGWCQVHGGDINDGIKMLNEAVRQLAGHREESFALGYLALAYWHRGDHEDTQRTAEEAVEKAQTPIQRFYGHEMLGYAATERKDFETAKMHFGICRNIAKDHSILGAMQNTYWSLGDLHFATGEYEAAVQEFEAYTKISSAFGRSDRYMLKMNEKMGRALAMIGRYDDALAFLMRSYRALQRGEEFAGLHVADAVLYCALRLGRDVLVDEVLGEAFELPDDGERNFVEPVAQALFDYLEETQNPRMQRCVEMARQSSSWMDVSELAALTPRL